MSTKDRERLHAVIDARLSGIAMSLREPPPWNEPWLRLGPESTWEERLLVCQAVRDSGSIPDEAGYFLVSWIIEDLAIAVESERVDSLAFHESAGESPSLGSELRRPAGSAWGTRDGGAIPHRSPGARPTP